MAKYLVLATLLNPGLGNLFRDSDSNGNFRSLRDAEDSINLSTNSLLEGLYTDCRLDDSDNFFNYFSENIERTENISLSSYSGKVILVVNVASFCDFTPQYYPLNGLQERYGDRGFRVLGFPCNQFNRQEPGLNASEILNSLKHVRPGNGFVPNFDMFAKTEVNGMSESPIFSFLKSRCDSPDMTFRRSAAYDYEPLHGDDIRWNFGKFLIDHSGNPVRRYAESVDPDLIAEDIERLLDRILEDDSSTELPDIDINDVLLTLINSSANKTDDEGESS